MLSCSSTFTTQTPVKGLDRELSPRSELFGHNHSGRKGLDWREATRSRLASILLQELIEDDDRRHGFDDRNCTRNDTWIVTTSSSQSA